MNKSVVYFMAFLLLIAAVSSLKVVEEDEIYVDAAVNENLYVAGGQIILDAAVKGDITAFGGMVSVNDIVEKGLLAFGGEVSVNSEVGDSATVCGGSININAPVAGDLTVCGGSVNVNSRVNGDIRAAGGALSFNGAGGDIIAFGGSININGPVAGDIFVKGGEVRISGAVAGDVKVTADKLTLGKGALIKGNLDYTVKEADFKEGQVEGQVIKGEPKKEAKINRTYLKIFGALSLLLIGILIVLIMPNVSSMLASKIETKPWMALLYGVITLIATPLAAVLIALSIIGIPITILLVIAYVVALLVAPVFSALVVGKLILTKEKTLLLPMVLGLIMYIVALQIPVLSDILRFAAILFGLGAISMAIFTKKKPAKKRR